VIERLNEVLGVGFRKYVGLYETEKIVQDGNSKNYRVKIYVEFSLYNAELGEWITFITLTPIRWDRQQQKIVVPERYEAYYVAQGWIEPQPVEEPAPTAPPASPATMKKAPLTNKLKQKPSPEYMQLKQLWQQLASSLDGFEEWVKKKQAEKMTEQQLMHILQRRLAEKHRSTSA
jgi:hypothetical protein